jgi:hypothetical protein
MTCQEDFDEPHTVQWGCHIITGSISRKKPDGFLTSSLEKTGWVFDDFAGKKEGNEKFSGGLLSGLLI